MTDTYLMLHQKEGIQFLRDHTRCVLADEAGLGKSRQVLEAATAYLKGRSMLVLCPTSLVENWKLESIKWGFPQNKIEIVGYEYQFLKRYKELRKRQWGVVVADEAHFLRNWSAQRTRYFKDFIKGRDFRIWFLTGTPLVKGAMDLHPLLSFIEPGKWGKFGEYCEKFCQKKPNQWKPGGYEYYGVRNGKILNAALNSVMIRRLKSEVLHDLPDKLTSVIPMGMGFTDLPIFGSEPIIRATIKSAESGSMVTDVPEFPETRRELGLKKVDSVVKFIEDTLDDHPLVIFAHHRLVLYDLQEKLKAKGKQAAVIIGGMDPEIRHKYVVDFQNEKIDILVCSISVAGVGLTLHRSSHCVFAEFPWTWAALEQAADRLHRIGQKNCVNVYHCVAKGTFEETQLRIINERKLMTHSVVGD